MKILLLTNEYPPYIYGGAGVHVDQLTKELTRLEDDRPALEILSFGDQNESEGNKRLLGIGPPSGPEFATLRYKKLLEPLYRNLVMTGTASDADLVHCHTWYTLFAGCLLQKTMDIPLVVTAHSLEPLRPWKKEQLGDAYYATMWLEKTALSNADGVIAVSDAMKSDMILHYKVDPDKVRIIYNGIDAERYRKTENPEVLRKYGIDLQKPYILFVGRITRQKGIVHLLDAVHRLKKGTQVVLCAGAPDTEEIQRETTRKVEEAKSRSGIRIVWIGEWLEKEELIPLYSHAALFVCPSVYEPFGLINLEAMACETAVVASATGGIKEVVEDGRTGLLVPFDPLRGDQVGPRDPEEFAAELAEAINSLLESPEKTEKMGAASRRRVEEVFSWKSIATRTRDFYRELTEKAANRRRERSDAESTSRPS